MKRTIGREHHRENRKIERKIEIRRGSDVVMEMFGLSSGQPE